MIVQRFAVAPDEWSVGARLVRIPRDACGATAAATAGAAVASAVALIRRRQRQHRIPFDVRCRCGSRRRVIATIVYIAFGVVGWYQRR